MTKLTVPGAGEAGANGPNVRTEGSAFAVSASAPMKAICLSAVQP
ncbi:hypothetical protein [Sphingomonas daechungensis]